MMCLLVAVVLFVHLSVCSTGDPCPPEDQLAPCTCLQIPALQQHTLTTLTNTIYETSPRRRRSVNPADIPILGNDTSFCTIVNCNDFKSIQDLEETVSSALSRKLIDKLSVSNVPPVKTHTLARLPNGWLKEVRVRNFEVSNTRLSGDFVTTGNPFEGQFESLLSVTARNCSLYGHITYSTVGTFNTQVFNTVPFLRVLDLSYNFLTYISSSAFRYPLKNLTTLILSYNSLQYIESTSFSYNTLLRYIDLSHNLLPAVGRNIFENPAGNLEHIDLSWNNLNTLPKDFFVNMTSLRFVDVSNNFLHTLGKDTWEIVWKQLSHIDVTGNFVQCNCNLTWLLPILSPPDYTLVNSEITAAPGPLAGQTVLGFCYRDRQSPESSIKHELITLTTDRLAC